MLFEVDIGAALGFRYHKGDAFTAKTLLVEQTKLIKHCGVLLE
jgi:hypothetical protein